MKTMAIGHSDLGSYYSPNKERKPKLMKQIRKANQLLTREIQSKVPGYVLSLTGSSDDDWRYDKKKKKIWGKKWKRKELH